MRTLHPRHRNADDRGFALLSVVGTMGVVTALLLAALGFALAQAKPSRASQDDKAALAAAQAGIDEYLARVTANDNYWSSDDCTNLALIPQSTTCTPAHSTTGVAVPGTSGAATYSYKLLSTPTTTASDGVVMLAVTGRSRTQSKTLIAEITPIGFLQYVYYTDYEDLDPALTNSVGLVRGTLNGQTYLDGSGNSGKQYWWYADPAQVTAICGSQHWYEGRSNPTYTTGKVIEYYYTVSGSGSTAQATGVVNGYPQDRTLVSGDTFSFSCTEIQFNTGDKITGPLKTNDALLLTGTPQFTSPTTETAWSTAPDPTRPWRGTGTPSTGTGPTDPGYSPKYGPALSMPVSNSALVTAAQTSSTGCVYTGATRIIFNADGTMSVKSPLTSTTSRCGGGSSTLTVTVPTVMYVQDGTAACTSGNVGYPITNESTTLGKTSDYDCKKGTAYISGTLKGRTTIATSNDVVVVGNTSYAGGLTGSDTLGLIPQNYAWIYHPVDSSGTNLLTTPVTQLDAAVLAVSHSLVVQNWNYGAKITTPLTVRGAIAQKYRGAVGTSGGSGTGYSKDYQFDARLAKAPPPYFLKPVNSPYTVSKVSG